MTSLLVVSTKRQFKMEMGFNSEADLHTSGAQLANDRHLTGGRG